MKHFITISELEEWGGRKMTSAEFDLWVPSAANKMNAKRIHKEIEMEAKYAENGIEIYNPKKELPYYIFHWWVLLDVFKYKITDFKKISTFDLPVALGQTRADELFMFDLCKMPHLLISGAAQQGKTVCLNAIIATLLDKKHPAELKFVFIFPKEKNRFTNLENHYLAKLDNENQTVISDIDTLKSLCKEMNLRYDLLKLAQTENIKEYNEKIIFRHLALENGHRFLPYIVVIIDDFDMIATKEIEPLIVQLAQLAHIVGIHLIIATQPKENVITNAIKANFPAHIDFNGVCGDLLFSHGDETTQVQCAFVEKNDVHIIWQPGFPTAYLLPKI